MMWGKAIFFYFYLLLSESLKYGFYQVTFEVSAEGLVVLHAKCLSLLSIFGKQ